MNYINYKSLYIDFLSDMSITLPLKIRSQLIKKIIRVKSEHLTTRQITTINNQIENHIIRLNSISFQHFVNSNFDEKHIKFILSYQLEHSLSDNQVSKEFKLSRNTLAKWKKTFGEPNEN